ncbi:Carboxylic ester hydrolase [Aphelenchoides besseyi]|nr:Carboxylic ester hydrolase [Aphelenchoides besseyi]KAI6210303.1 Carboxylic ester hydrolase [Aphelenchoides besseyi]
MFGTCLRLVAICVLANAASIRLEPQAQLRQGRVEGFQFKYPDGSERNANVFLGVPYAKTPARFERPQPVDASSALIDATRFGPGCISFSHPSPVSPPPPMGNVTVENVKAPVVSEDCLTLNIMAPAEKSPFPHGFPVLVWIHGGGFAGGSAEMYGFKELAHEFAGQGVVMVTLQYRLGIFGFFSTGDSTAPGNLGLWDQREALLWIQENIHAFGGDPKRVTLWGQNAGSASVGALAVSPKTRDLFHQSIQMSGSLLAGWAFSDRVVDESAKLAKAAGCVQRSSSLVLECLKAKSEDQLLEAAKTTGWRRDALNFARFQMRPDGEFFDKDYASMLAESPRKPTIQGMTSQESMVQTLPFASAPRQSKFVVAPERLNDFGRADLVRFIHDHVARPEVFGAQTDAARERLVQFYADRNVTDTPFFYLTRYTQLLSDSQFAIPIIMEVRHKSEENWPVFLYLTNYMNPKIKLPVLGTYSTYEFPYLFGLSVVGPFEFDQQDRKLQTLIVMSFANFVHSGNPSTQIALWPSVNEEHPLGFFDMRPDPVLRDNLMLDRFVFWKQMAQDFDYDLIRDLNKRTQQPVHLDE